MARPAGAAARQITELVRLPGKAQIKFLATSPNAPESDEDRRDFLESHMSLKICRKRQRRRRAADPWTLWKVSTFDQRRDLDFSSLVANAVEDSLGRLPLSRLG